MKRLRFLLLALVCIPLIVTSSAAAWSPLQGINCGKAGSSAVCQDRANGQNPLAGPNGLFIKIANIIAAIAGIAAVIMIILAGLRFVTSGSSSEDIAGARRTIIYCIVGLVIIVLGRALLGLILSKL